MSDIQNIKKLRSLTGAGFKDCSSALEESSGKIDKAIEILRIKGISKASKKMLRNANEGLIAISGKQIMRELLQNKMSVENIVADMKNNFENKEKISTELKKASNLLTKPNFSRFLDQINDYCRR